MYKQLYLKFIYKTNPVSLFDIYVSKLINLQKLILMIYFVLESEMNPSKNDSVVN